MLLSKKVGQLFPNLLSQTATAAVRSGEAQKAQRAKAASL